MENKPSLEDVWTDRIFDAFTKKHKLANSGARYLTSDIHDAILIFPLRFRNDNNGTATG